MATISEEFEDGAELAIKAGILSAIDHIPVIGDFLGIISEELWPAPAANTQTPEQVFDSISDRINDLISNAIDVATAKRLQSELIGIGGDIALYRKAHDDQASTQFNSSRTVITNSIPHFQESGNEVKQLLLYVQLINVWLSFFRDGVLRCSDPLWKMDASDQAQLQADLVTEISTAKAYVAKTYQTGLSQRQAEAASMAGAAKFNHVNDYVRTMTLGALDYAELWDYADPVAYPAPVTHQYTRLLYGQAQGFKRTADVVLPADPVGDIQRIRYADWAFGGTYCAVHDVMVDYPAGKGPGGQTSTGLNIQPPGPAYFTVGSVIDGLVLTEVRSWVGEIIDGIQLVGTWNGQAYTAPIHGSQGDNTMVSNSLPNHIVSSIHIDGQAYWNGAYLPDVLVVGFRPIDSRQWSTSA